MTKDNNLRPDTTLEKLASLKPAFGKKNANPTMTAGNSTPLTDGASVVLLSSDAWAKEHGHEPLAYITHQQTAAVDFIGKEGLTEGLLMAPAYAVPKMLKRAGLTLQDFDFYEIHEAFASQVLSTLAAWEDETFCKTRLGLDAPLGSIDRSKLNVNGSSLAAGHPLQQQVDEFWRQQPNYWLKRLRPCIGFYLCCWWSGRCVYLGEIINQPLK